MQHKLQQKLLSFDISAISSADDFTKIFELLNQIENKEFVQRIQQKLNNNLAFKNFSKEQPDLVQNFTRENTLSSRLTGLVVGKQSSTRTSTINDLTSRTIIQQQIQTLILGGAYIEGIKKAFDLDFSFGLETSIKLIESYFSKGKPEKTLYIADEMANNTLKVISDPNKILTDEDRKKIEEAKDPIKMAAIANAPNNPKQVAELLLKINAIDESLKNDESHQWFKRVFSFSENGKLTINTNVSQKDWAKVEKFLKDETLINKYKKSIFKAFENEGYSKEEAQKAWDIITQGYNELREKAFLSKKLQDIKEEIENTNGKIKAKDLNNLFNEAIDSSFKEMQGKPITEIIDGIKLSRRLFKENDDLNLDNFRFINDQFKNFTLYYVNAKREMGNNPDKYPTLTDFINSREGKKLGFAKQLLGTSLAKIASSIEPDKAIELLLELGIERKYTIVLLEAVKELEQDNKNYQKILERSAKRDYQGGRFLTLDLDGSATYQFTEDGFELSLDRKQQKELEELQNKNPNWEKSIEEKNQNEQAHNSKSSENVREEYDFLIEDEQQIKKLEISLFETNERFDTNKSITQEKTQRYAQSI